LDFLYYLSNQGIVDFIKISRETMSKYILVLEAEGKTKTTKITGNAKLFEIN